MGKKTKVIEPIVEEVKKKKKKGTKKNELVEEKPKKKKVEVKPIVKELPKKPNPDQLYRGYINYRIIDKPELFKTHHFADKLKSEVDKLEAQFMNPNAYIYIGSKVSEQ